MQKKSAISFMLIAGLLLLTGGCASIHPAAEDSHYVASNIDKTPNAKAGFVLSLF